jgi:Zn-dependent alcohol dehydrogenase
MRAALLEKAQEPLSIVADVEISDPGPREVVVKVANCGICHSDLSMVDNAGGTPLPVILGHEAAGVVEAVGTGVTRLAKGDSVMLTPLPPCGHCYYCVRQQPTLCVDAQGFMTGTRADGSSPLSRGDATVYRGFGLGGWGEYTVVGENSAIKIPEDTPLEVACVIGCAIQTGVGAVLNTAKVEEGATVLDILDPGQDDIVARAVELTGGIGVDYAFDGAGMHELIQQCIQASRIGGTTVMVGAPMDLRPLEIPIPALFLTHEKKVMGSLLGSCHSHRDVPRFLALWRAGKLDLESMVSHRRPVEEVNAGLDDMRAARGLRTVLSF